MHTTPAPKDRTLILILSIIGVLVLVSLVVVFTRGAPETLDPTTPEGVVQAYSAAVIDGDEAAVAAFLTEDAAVGCSQGERGPTDNLRVVLVSTTVRPDSADVIVSLVTSYDDGPFGASEYEFESNFDLVRVDGDWLIAQAPWELTICPNPTLTK
ncbi:hypothetical protein E3O25_08810 [Cryobacterium sp. TMT1-3]|uniref:Lipoprotein LpqB N-terminal domain-containing protein n=1 Tax=Cryobacterium luteum TaxID=1424661 RepID=A0A1H8JWK4_9MICO|nr:MULTISPECIES: hypothetical protein [Cryobacterium]TFB81983.1 hypothetical protein E3O10_17965 [Cryobacterium luteum]TFC28238.1 hypothetical protein E3O25_08810 [Cryobacterium sp. TMT1-3]SEN85103.1 hypothetical protein SAMN05216281_11645 [Cryobacterium luteum]